MRSDAAQQSRPHAGPAPFDPWANLREADRRARACGHHVASLLGCEACRAAGAARLALARELRDARDRGELERALALLWEQID